MIHLFTGLPGSQKTANMLHYIRQRTRDDWQNRPVYYYNVRGLSVDGWSELSEDEAREWYTLPEGSVILLDEAQTLFRPVHKRDQVAPKEITELETHRHHGYDIFLTTQHPMLLHTAVRRQVQFHWHLERPYGMKTKALAWEKCINEPDDHFARKDADIKSVKVPSEVFALYTSTVLDTQKKRIPKKLLVVLASFLAVAVGIGWFVSGFQDSKQEMLAAAGGPPLPADSPAGMLDQYMAPALPSNGNQFQPVYPVDPVAYQKLYEPRVAGVPSTAPIYDELVKPVSAPKTYCFSYRRSGTDYCKCVTQQMTPISMGYAQCKSIVNNGLWDATIPSKASYDSRGQRIASLEN